LPCDDETRSQPWPEKRRPDSRAHWANSSGKQLPVSLANSKLILIERLEKATNLK
jgi:hypothetical protein